MLVSYDYEYVYDSLPLLYESADVICLSIDNNRQTWSGNSYELPDSFFNKIREIDKDGKIKIYEDSFYDPSLSSWQNETRQRNMSREFVGKEGWCIQIDSDEYFYDFEAFTKYLQKLNHKKQHNIYVKWISLYKRDEGGFYVINSLVNVPVAAINFEKYSGARVFDAKRKKTYFTVWHNSWARSPREIKQKLNNWGHKDDFDTNLYFKKWLELNNNNYREYKNFHPLGNGKAWRSLSYFPADDIGALIERTREIKRKIMFQDGFFKPFLTFLRPGFFK